MAMNKKEQAMVEALRVQAAFHRTVEVLPDVPLPELDAKELSVGYLPVGTRGESARVERACSSRTGHSVGTHDRTTSQNPRTLYSTRMLALQALRYEVEQECALRLRRIDKMMEAEQLRLDNEQLTASQQETAQ